MIRASIPGARLSGTLALFTILFGAAANLAGQTSPAGSRPELEQRNPRYIIQRQDVLLLSFPLSPEINQTVSVQPDGYINLQNGRSVHAQGLSVPELADAIKTAYAGTLHDPISQRRP